MRSVVVLALAALMAACAHRHLPPPPSALQLGDPVRGLTFARQNCASCHAVEAGVNWSPDLAAPAFESIANTRGMNARSVNVWLGSDHPSMPQLIVAPEDGDDLWAYMLTLRRR